MPHRTLSIFPEAPPPRRIDYQRELNEAQYQAVTTREGPVLVIAGAGSGKTRTLVYRLAYLVEQGVDPGSILLLTFTRKSAQEMLTRAVHLLNHGPGGGHRRHLPQRLLPVAAPVTATGWVIPTAFRSWTAPTRAICCKC